MRRAIRPALEHGRRCLEAARVFLAYERVEIREASEATLVEHRGAGALRITPAFVRARWKPPHMRLHRAKRPARLEQGVDDAALLLQRHEIGVARLHPGPKEPGRGGVWLAAGRFRESAQELSG